ncbi:MAG: hypothetical protein R8G66_13885 [Cytophagales bacterium]|nr:hypothetical protein [Cytophagales bacterium]
MIDLLIVIIGVYCAFLIQQSAEQRKDNESRDRVLTALKFELETFRFTMSRVNRSMIARTERLEKIQARGSYSNYSKFRFIEPQYDYQAIEYALNMQDIAIVDFELTEALQTLWVQIKRVEHVEQLLTATSEKYRSIPPGLDQKSNEYQLLWSENIDHFSWYIFYMNDRASTSEQVVIAANAALSVLNDQLGEQKRLASEYEIIQKRIHQVASSEDEAVGLAKVFYPHIPEEDIRKIYRETNQ